MPKSFYALVTAAIALAAATFGSAQPASAQADVAQPEPVLLELFTSQGCSSCPPADRLAAKLAREPDLVVISKPVTYWDRLGWKDTLAREDNTDLQRRYARRGLGGYNGVYTPQLVVDGKLGEVGSDERAVRRNIAAARSAQSAAIRVIKGDSGSYGIGLGGFAKGPAELVLAAISSAERVGIGRGENRGRQITYTNVLIDERVIARWDGGKASHRLTTSQLNVAGADRYALVLREMNSGQVLAARWLR